MKYILRVTTAVILGEVTVRYLQGIESNPYWPMLPNWVWRPAFFLSWIDSWSPIIYLFFLVAALLPEWIGEKLFHSDTDHEVLDDV
jgi:hypothetical protein